MNDDEKKKVVFDKKAKNICFNQPYVWMNSFVYPNVKQQKRFWNTLEVTNESTIEVKTSKLNTLSQEYEMFRMQPRESIIDLQKRITHLINHFMALRKTLQMKK